MLYIVATPIGNLKDITLRAIETLREVDFILSEDTRVTKRLLNHLEIQKATISFHEHSEEGKFDEIFEKLREGKKLALVTDAGTPAISDPGAYLVRRVREVLPEVNIVTIPGPSALAAAVSLAGLVSKEFTFLAFPPHKKGRKTFFEDVAKIVETRPVVFYESTHRLMKALESLLLTCATRRIVVAKELTKMFEETVVGTPAEVMAYFNAYPDKVRGEFVIVVE